MIKHLNLHFDAEYADWQARLAADPGLSTSDEFTSWTQFNSSQIKAMLDGKAARTYRQTSATESALAMLRRARRQLVSAERATIKARLLLDKAFTQLTKPTKGD